MARFGSSELSRRQFFRYVSAAASFSTLPFLATLNAWAAPQEDDPAKVSAGGPANPSWRTALLSPKEPGELLTVTGIIYAPDGRTPVEGARLYVYQTDARGLYVPRLSLRRTPRIRGWMKTGADGRYEFRSIKPGSYPNNRTPAHIHASLSAPSQAEHWIDDFLFEGDAYLSEKDKAAPGRDGEFSNVLRLTRDPDGAWRSVRHIRLR